MKRKLIGIGAVVLTLVLLLTLAPSCGKEEGEIKTLKIGFIGPLSGPASPWGTDHETGAKWAADDINAAGGIKVGGDKYMIEVISCDTKMTGSSAATCANELVFDHDIHYVIGPIGTDLAVIPIFHENKCFNISIGAAFNGGPDKPYYINGSTYYPQWTIAYYRAAMEHHPEVKTAANIGPDTERGHAQVEDWSNAAAACGVTVVAKDYYTAGITDFYPLLTKMLASDPDIIQSAGCPAGDTALICKQARELGFTGLLWPSSCPLGLMVDTVGLEYLYDIGICLPDFSTEAYSPQMRDLDRKYMEERARPDETDMPDCVVHGYSAMTFYKKAIETAGSIDPDEVLNVIDDPDFSFERYYVPNAKLGGIETFGVRRSFPHFCPYSEIVVEEGEARVVQKGGAPVVVP